MAKETTTATAKGPDTSAWATAGRNVKYTTLDDMLFIAVPISAAAIAAAPPSATGKTTSIASTLGNVAIPGTPVKMGVNVYAPK